MFRRHRRGEKIGHDVIGGRRESSVKISATKEHKEFKKWLLEQRKAKRLMEQRKAEAEARLRASAVKKQMIEKEDKDEAEETLPITREKNKENSVPEVEEEEAKEDQADFAEKSTNENISEEESVEEEAVEEENRPKKEIMS